MHEDVFIQIQIWLRLLHDQAILIRIREMEMSLKVKCFATVIASAGLSSALPSDDVQVDGHIEIHSNLFELSNADFLKIIFNEQKEVAIYTFKTTIGEEGREIFIASSPIFTKYSFQQLNESPVPIINQLISAKKYENPKFQSSRFWAFKNYFFVTNRDYSENEINELKMKIHYIVKNLMMS